MSTATKQEHWAAKYKTASRTTLEGWIYLAACTCRGPEEHVREVGRIAYTQMCGIWHAAWIASGKKSKCMCAPCVKARGEKLTCI